MTFFLKEQEVQEDQEEVVIEADDDEDEDDETNDEDDDEDEANYRQKRSESDVIRSAGLARSYTSISLSNFNLLSSGSSSKIHKN